MKRMIQMKRAWLATLGLALTAVVAQASSSQGPGHELDCTCDGFGAIQYTPDPCVASVMVGWSIWDGACYIFPVCDEPTPCSYETSWYALERPPCDVTFELFRNGALWSSQDHEFEDDVNDDLGCEAFDTFTLKANGNVITQLTLICRDCLAAGN